jgi:hypothetical protein
MSEQKFDMAAYREGFVSGWFQCVGNKEPDKDKLRQIAEAAADNFLGVPPSMWIPVAKQMPHDGQLVVLRMVEAGERGDIRYAIGWYDGPTMRKHRLGGNRESAGRQSRVGPDSLVRSA